MPAFINHIACAVPPHERQAEFLDSLAHWISPAETVEKLRQVALHSGIRQRYTVLDQPFGGPDSGAFYEFGQFPGTGARMERYRNCAPVLALEAVRQLEHESGPLAERVTHLIVTSCTGFYAPGLDIDLMRGFGLSPTIQRSQIGFMGCHAGLVALRAAGDIVQAHPEAVVLTVNVELCSLHLQQTSRMDRLISFLLFADGAAASLVTGRASGLRIDKAWSHASLEDSERMAWHIEDQGFAMTLDARLPARIRQFLRAHPEYTGAGSDPGSLWTVHPGGRLILDSVQDACGLTDGQMAASRRVLSDYGNMSSASILFALREQLQEADDVVCPGYAMAFGPGLTIEGLHFTRLARALAAPSKVVRGQPSQNGLQPVLD